MENTDKQILPTRLAGWREIKDELPEWRHLLGDKASADEEFKAELKKRQILLECRFEDSDCRI